MKNAAWKLGIIALTAMIGFLLISCDNNSGDSQPELKQGTIVITGIPPYFNGSYATFHADGRDTENGIMVQGVQEFMATGDALVEIRNGSVTLPARYSGGPTHGQTYYGNHTFTTPVGTNSSGNRVRLQIFNVPQTNWEWDDATWSQHTVYSIRFSSVTFQNGAALITMPTITITGLTEHNGKRASVSIETHMGGGGSVAFGGWGNPQPDITVSNGRVTLPLRSSGPNNQAWTGSGSYQLTVHFGPPGAPHDGTFAYTGGKTLEELGIPNNQDAINEKLPKFEFKSATTTVAFNQFKQFDTPWN